MVKVKPLKFVEYALERLDQLLRKLLSILLLVAFWLPLAIPLLATGGDSMANVPACCRKNGTHHCIMSLSEKQRTSQDETYLIAPRDKCPYCPGAIPANQQTPYVTAKATSLKVSVAAHPSGVAQTESKRRISLDRSRQKRGPPVLSLL